MCRRGGGPSPPSTVAEAKAPVISGPLEASEAVVATTTAAATTTTAETQQRQQQIRLGRSYQDILYDGMV